jgi:hypothetical protein
MNLSTNRPDIDITASYKLMVRSAHPTGNFSRSQAPAWERILGAKLRWARAFVFGFSPLADR